MVRTKKDSKQVIANRGFALKHLSNLRKVCNMTYGVFPTATIRIYPLMVEAILRTNTKNVKLSYSLTSSRELSLVDLDSNYCPSGVVSIQKY